MNPAAEKHVFSALDAGRGVAALMVIVHHLPEALRGHAFESANLAVDFFFGLSGFVLAHAYLDKLTAGRMSVREFMVVRLIRLYPLYLFSLILLLVWLAGMVIDSRPIPWSIFALAGKLPFALVMLPSPSLDFSAYLYPFNIAAWSIAFELAVNLVFAIYARQMQRPAVRWAVIAVSGVLLIVQLLVKDELGGSSWNTIVTGVPRVCFSFFLGMQLYEWHCRRTPTRRTMGGATSLAALAVLFGLLVAPAHLWLELGAIFLVFPLLIVVLGAAELPDGRVGDALQRLGVLSYAVYVLHGPLLRAWLYLYPASVLDAKVVIGTTLLLVTVVAVSWAADRWFDRPIRSKLQLRLRQRASRAPAAAQR